MSPSNPASPTASPKRKREDISTTFSPLSSPLRHRTAISAAQSYSSTAHHIPASRTTPKKLRQQSQPRPATPDSPRTLVAEKLNDLDLANGEGSGVSKLSWLSHRPKSVSTLADSESIPQLDGSMDIDMTDVKEAGTRKKVRTSLNGVKEIPETPQGSFYAEDAAGMGVNMDVERTESFQEAPVRNGRTVVFRGNGEVKEVKETPHARRVGLGVPPVGFVEKHTVFPTSIPSSEPAVMSDAAPAPFPASTRLASAKHDTEMPTLSPEEEGEESLHWSDSEITGHDPSDPEDDGEGINGIGFKPTAAMARSRAEKRRRQLAEYKSREDREAREARAKRLAARKAAARGDGEGGREANSSEEERRRVRFEGVERAIDVL